MTTPCAYESHDSGCAQTQQSQAFIYELSDGTEEGASRDSIASMGGGGGAGAGEEAAADAASSSLIGVVASGEDEGAAGRKQGGGTGGDGSGGDDDEVQIVDGDGGGAGRKQGGAARQQGGGAGKDAAAGEDDEMEIVGAEGQFVLMDCAHSRDTCVTFPFGGDDKAKACDNCWCFVCEEPWHQCKSWSAHCNACYADPKWRVERDDVRRRRKQGAMAAAGASAPAGPAGVAGEAKEVELDAKQQQVLDLCLQGKNTFFTGMGGTGKSLVLKLLLERLRALHGAHAVAITAPTGVAAINVGGQTLHSFAGCGVPTCVANFSERMWRRRQTWQGLKALVVDEVSMLDAALLDWLDVTVRCFRGKRHREKAFGGIQLIFAGDFHQLPAVRGKSLPSSHQAPGRPGAADVSDRDLPVALKDLTSCIFQTACFKEANFHVVELTKVFRQEEREFISMLTRVRQGDVDDRVLRFFGKLLRPLPNDDIKPTKLMCLVKDVHKENCEQLRALPGTTHWYRAHDSFAYDDAASSWDRSQRKLELCELMKDDSQVAQLVQLKVGAQVMLTKNMLQVIRA